MSQESSVNIKNVTIFGGGQMGSGIAHVSLNLFCSIYLLLRNEEFQFIKTLSEMIITTQHLMMCSAGVWWGSYTNDRVKCSLSVR